MIGHPIVMNGTYQIGIPSGEFDHTTAVHMMPQIR